MNPITKFDPPATKIDDPRHDLMGWAEKPINHTSSSRSSRIETRFFDRVRITDGCWEWVAADRARYGEIWVKYRVMHTHVWSWEFFNGRKVPEGLWVLHRCDNPPCVRPEHLYVGDCRQNSRDMVERGRQGETGKKLTKTAVRELRLRLAAEGRYYGSGGDERLAAELGISVGTIAGIRSGKLWSRSGALGALYTNRFETVPKPPPQRRRQKHRSLRANAKLTEAQVREIKSYFKVGWRLGDHSKLAKRFGVSRETIRQVRVGLSWGHVQTPAKDEKGPI